MAWLFSKRCKQALRSGQMKVSIPMAVRRRIWIAMRDFNEYWDVTSDSGYRSNTSTLEELEKRFKAELGVDEFQAYPEGKEGLPSKSDLEGMVLRGSVPSHVFDACEILYLELPEINRYPFQKRFHQIMEESDAPWRMSEGQVFPVDSAYIEQEILRHTHELLNQKGFHGALEEFRKARTDLVNGDYTGAIQNANLAFESTMKGILGVERAKPGELYRNIRASGLVPEYFDGFVGDFEKNILRSVTIIRNEEKGAGHGQGAKVHQVPKSLAELAVNLSGVLIKYLIERHLDEQPNTPKAQTAQSSKHTKRAEPTEEVDELPF